MNPGVSELVALIEKQKPKRVLLQLPEGLQQYATEIVDKLKCDVIVSASPCYGACCLAVNEAKDTDCDLLVHVGHNEFGFENVAKTGTVRVLFYPWALEIGFESLDVGNIKEMNLGLVATIQYLDELNKLKSMLTGKKVKVLGQVLGCKTPVIPKNVDAVVYLGSGMFHPTAFTNIPVYIIDPYTGSIDLVEKSSFVEAKKVAAALSKLEDAQSVGILVSSQPGQRKLDIAQKIKQGMEKKGKKSYIIYANEITEKALAGLSIDVFINTSCPRIRQDYLGKPVINYTDIQK